MGLFTTTDDVARQKCDLLYERFQELKGMVYAQSEQIKLLNERTRQKQQKETETQEISQSAKIAE